MEEDNPEFKPERPRYLLPYGCKDLIDAIRLRKRHPQSGGGEAPKPPVPVPATPPVSAPILPPKFPPFVPLPDPIAVRDLAAALGLKTFVIIKVLMELDIFANPNIKLDFAIAFKVCARYGVQAVKAS